MFFLRAPELPLLGSGAQIREEIKRKEYPIAQDQGLETQKMALTTTNSEALFEGGIQQLYVVADADSQIDFDQPTDAGSLLIKANLAPARIDFHGVNVKKIHAKAVTGSANLYLLGVRN